MSEKSSHDEYWKGVADSALDRIHRLFREGACVSAEDLIDDGNGIDDRDDVETVLAYVLRHGDPCERATATLASFELLQAWHELSEHKGGTA